MSNISDVAILRVFLGQRETWLYRQVIAIKWYEIISKFVFKYVYTYMMYGYLQLKSN